MKLILLLFLIVVPTFEYAMKANARPLVVAARNRELRRPFPPVRQIIIARFINGQWYEKIYTKELKDQAKGPFLKHPELETHTRVKRDKPWRRSLNNEA